MQGGIGARSEFPLSMNPHLQRWMMFVDGENFTVRAQQFALENQLALREGEHYMRDVFVWMPDVKPREKSVVKEALPVQEYAIRSYYYTSFSGDDEQRVTVRQALRNMGFHPEVFKKIRKNEKAKGVDIALTKDLLSHAFLNNYDVALLVAGDGDYVPLVQEVKRLGKVVYVAFLSGEKLGLSQELHLNSDEFFSMNEHFLEQWRKDQR